MLPNKDVKIIPRAWKETYCFFFFLNTSILNCSPRSFHHFCTLNPLVLFLMSGSVTEVCQVTEIPWFPCHVHVWQYSHLLPCSLIKPGIIQRFSSPQLSCQSFVLLLYLCCIAGSGDRRWSWAVTLGSCARWATSSAPNCVLITSVQTLRVSVLKMDNNLTYQLCICIVRACISYILEKCICVCVVYVSVHIHSCVSVCVWACVEKSSFSLYFIKSGS